MAQANDLLGSGLRMTTREGARFDQLGQLRPANTNAASIYAPILNVVGIVTSIIVTNSGAADIQIRIFHDKDGTTYDQTTALVYDQFVPVAAAGPPVEFNYIIFTFDGGLGVRNPGNIAVRTSAANDATFTVYGKELTQTL